MSFCLTDYIPDPRFKLLIFSLREFFSDSSRPTECLIKSIPRISSKGSTLILPHDFPISQIIAVIPPDHTKMVTIPASYHPKIDGSCP